MITDSLYIIGSSHSVCQDYADHGKEIGILSDGCSSSPDTDIGARILVQVAKEFVQSVSIDWKSLAQEALDICVKFSHQRALDCTISSFSVINNICHINMIGDGCLVLISKNNDIEFYNIDYEHNAPVYLTYILNSDLLRYKETYKKWECICYKSDLKNGAYSQVIDDPELKIPIFKKNVSMSMYKTILLFSDGISSIMDQSRRIVELDHVISEISKIKFETVEFLQKLRAFFAAKKWEHYDDLSVVGLINP